MEERGEREQTEAKRGDMSLSLVGNLPPRTLHGAATPRNPAERGERGREEGGRKVQERNGELYTGPDTTETGTMN